MTKFSTLLEKIENKAYIGGEFVTTELTFPVYNPYTGEIFAQSADCHEKDSRQALSKAVGAFGWWKLTGPRERAAKLRKWSNEIRENHEEIAKLMTTEQGKPLGEARGEVLQAAVMIDWFAEETRRALSGEALKSRREECGNAIVQTDFVLKSPVGVVLAVTPWNFPFIAPVVKCACAIAAGCTTILKPSEETPLVSMALAYCADRAGLDKGQFSVLPCRTPGTVSDFLMASPEVRMLSFTGSTAVGKFLYAKAAETMKKTAFELGGNAPFVVFEDADLDVATRCAKGARFYNNGQICIGANRILVHEEIYAKFVDLYKAQVRGIVTGSGLISDTHTGPLINRPGLEKVEHLVQDAVSKGATIVCGGRKSLAGGSGGLNYEPTIMANATREMDAYHTEVFGPVAFVYKFSSEDEAIALANETPYGLAAYIFTRSQARLWRLSEQIEAGMIGANTTDITGDDLPFGGIKQSGYGREGGQGCLEEYLEKKLFCVGLQR